jgi:hypothetical protein
MVLTDGEIHDLWRRLWETATGQTDAYGRRRHTSGIKWLLREYGVTVTQGYGPHAPVREEALRRLEALGAIERIGGGDYRRTRAMWVARPSDRK